jgi:YggT family protein
VAATGASSLIPLAITRDTVADYVGAVFLVYLVLIIVRVLLTWIPRMPYNRALRAVVGFIEEVTDPYLNVFRRFLPPIGGGAFALDLSPILAIILLVIAQQVVVGLIRG